MNDTNVSFTTYYGPVDKRIIEKAKKVRLLILDVDGVLSDGLVYVGNNGEELKTFYVRDGYGIRHILAAGIEVAVITGQKNKLIEHRCKTLGILHLYQGQFDKKEAFNNLLNNFSTTSEYVAYIGDDLLDWPAMAKSGLSIAVSNAHPFLLPRADYVTYMNGGYGAVREVCDLLMLAHGKLDKFCID